ncbi:SH3 domain-containing kinase-binding protein 1-like [Centroberyx affinis]|uniref:SH3 domain-containing kinase-binding protein 1-like n=1 Tax=Centroberyx affinis TaxID=166261 RepID=UPI003A5BBD2D
MPSMEARPSPPSAPVPSTEAKPSPPSAPVPSTDGLSQGSRVRLEPEDQGAQLDELRSQMKELLLSVELLKTQQMREMAELRGELDEERLKRVALQMEVEKLKRNVHST